MSNPAVEAAGPTVEKFAPAAGRWLGWLGVVLGALIVGSAVVDDPAHDWTAIGIGTAIGLVSWVVLIRPAVSLHAHGVLLRNMVRDIYLPFAAIERCKAAQTLMVNASGRTFHGLGVSRSARSLLREQRGGRSAFGALAGMSGNFGSRAADPEPTHRFANEEQTGGTYSSYVESRIMSGTQGQHDDSRTEPQVAVDPVAVGALVVAVLGIVLAVLL